VGPRCGKRSNGESRWLATGLVTLQPISHATHQPPLKRGVPRAYSRASALVLAPSRQESCSAHPAVSRTPAVKFCGECGASLKVKCASCGFANAPGIKFRGECGKPLAEAAKPALPRDLRSYTPKHLAEKILTSRSALDSDRKQVTVLFADVKGSMELAEQLDPEEQDWIEGVAETRKNVWVDTKEENHARRDPGRISGIRFRWR
jgi:hypothetical protein